MKETIKKLIAITAVCLIAAQTVDAVPVKDAENIEMILCSDKPVAKPVEG